MTREQKTAFAIIGVGILIALYAQQDILPVATVTTSEGFDLSPYGGPTVYPEPIKRFARAIASAEGFGLSGAIPTIAHNPGDLKPPGWDGPTLGSGIAVFNDDASGWNALYKQLWLILTGASSYYNLDMSIADMGNTWAPAQGDSWAQNVARFLGVDASSSLVSQLA